MKTRVRGSRGGGHCGTAGSVPPWPCFMEDRCTLLISGAVPLGAGWIQPWGATNGKWQLISLVVETEPTARSDPQMWAEREANTGPRSVIPRAGPREGHTLGWRVPWSDWARLGGAYGLSVLNNMWISVGEKLLFRNLERLFSEQENRLTPPTALLSPQSVPHLCCPAPST